MYFSEQEKHAQNSSFQKSRFIHTQTRTQNTVANWFSLFFTGAFSFWYLHSHKWNIIRQTKKCSDLETISVWVVKPISKVSEVLLLQCWLAMLPQTFLLFLLLKETVDDTLMIFVIQMILRVRVMHFEANMTRILNLHTS